MSGHTPEPWEVVELSTESPMFSIERAVEEDAVDGKRVLSFVVADIRHVDNPEVVRANAQLIAESPSTVEALQDLVDWVDPNENMDGQFWQLDCARDAIAKASGKPTKVEVTS